MIKNNLTISFYTFGCRLNQSETAVIENSCEQNGFSVVEFGKPTDIVVINTCTVTENGDADTRRLVQKVNRTNPKARIALVGCQAQIQKEKLTALPNVRWVVGNAKKMDLASILKETEKDFIEPKVITPAITKESFTIPVAGIDRQHTRANLKIQDGCDFFCSFCEIPYARGRARSRDFNDILKEANILAAHGHQELVLTGINLGTYRNSNKTFFDVVEALEQIDKLKRIRVSSIEPTTIPLKLLKKMAKESKLCRYLHIPIQSASDKILSLMKRKYTFKKFFQFINEAYAFVPEICIGTDVIVGFPQETESDFALTAQRLRELPVHYFHVFSYSKRTFAKSQFFKNTVKNNDIQKRSQILRDLSNRKKRLFWGTLLNSTQKVLFEEKKNTSWIGLTDNYVRVEVISEENLNNRLLEVKLKEIGPKSIKGILL